MEWESVPESVMLVVLAAEEIPLQQMEIQSESVTLLVLGLVRVPRVRSQVREREPLVLCDRVRS